MEYKSESIDTSFGKGVRIEKGRRSYEQISCSDGLHTRIFKAPYEEDGQLVNTGYHGVVFRQLFDDTEKDYEQFRVLAERLQQASGEEVPNTKARFMDYISHSGLEKELQRVGATVRINLSDKEGFPDKMDSWLDLKSYLGGAITSLAGYGAGFAIIANTVPDAELGKDLAMYGIFAPVFEGLSGLFTAIISENRFWCGLLNAPGFITSRAVHNQRLRDPNYMLNNFLQDYQKLEAMGSSVGNQKKFAKQSKLADRHFGVLEDLFPFTQHQKGFSLTYDSQNREDVLNFFSYVLQGGNTPQLPNSQARVSKPTENEKVEIKPVQTNFINPWGIEIPKIGGKKDE
jgi:hypothetical protein